VSGRTARSKSTTALSSPKHTNQHHTMWDFFADNWAELALALIGLMGTITALTSTTKDDTVVDILRRILMAVVVGKTPTPKP
jgi:hypothetical protein